MLIKNQWLRLMFTSKYRVSEYVSKAGARNRWWCLKADAPYWTIIWKILIQVVYLFLEISSELRRPQCHRHSCEKKNWKGCVNSSGVCCSLDACVIQRTSAIDIKALQNEKYQMHLHTFQPDNRKRVNISSIIACEKFYSVRGFLTALLGRCESRSLSLHQGASSWVARLKYSTSSRGS